MKKHRLKSPQSITESASGHDIHNLTLMQTIVADRRSSWLLILLIFTLTVACSRTKPFNLTLGTVDEASPQQDAAIQLSDAQVYARETMVNDRRNESKYLSKLLDDSPTLQF